VIEIVVGRLWYKLDLGKIMMVSLY
jgi:hypothetical protein